MAIEEPHTHPLRPTLALNDASDLALRLITDIYSITKPEEMAAIAETYLDLARMEGPREA